jgi:hypothetical protein
MKHAMGQTAFDRRAKTGTRPLAFGGLFEH